MAGVNANYAALMGRAAVHTGQRITWEQMTQSIFGFLSHPISSWDDPAPIQIDETGRYPMPVPGQWTEL